MNTNNRIELIFSGDFAPIIHPHDISDSHFADLKEILFNCDLHITNLECPLTLCDEKISKTGPHLRAHPSTVSLLKQANVSIACLANNHIYDFGKQGVFDTQNICQLHNIETLGIVSKFNSTNTHIIKDIKGKKIGFLNYCEHEFSVRLDSELSANGYDPVNAFYDISQLKFLVDYIIVIYHGGNEYFEFPPPYMQKTFRFLADLGADVVIGHHSHVMSGFEIYHNKFLIYGLGNFFFPFEGEPESWNLGLIAQVIIHKRIEIKLQPIFQCKNNLMVLLPKKDEHTIVERKINELSAIISSSAELQLRYDSFATGRETQMLKLFPCMTLIHRLALKLGFPISRLMPRKRILMFYNILRCEAHNYLLNRAIQKQLHK